MFTRTAALMSRSFCELTQVLICIWRPANEERVQGAVGFMQLRHVRKVVQDNQHLIQFLHLQLLGRLRCAAAPPRPSPPVRLFPFGVHPQVLLDVIVDGNPAVVDGNGRTEDVDSLEDAPVLLQNQADQSHGFAGPRKMPVHRTSGTTGAEDCLLLYSGTGNSLIFPIPLFLLPKFDAGKPGGGSGSASLCTDALPGFSEIN